MASTSTASPAEYFGKISGLKLGPATRDAFGEALKSLGAADPNIVVVDGDVGNSTRTEPFAKAFPDRSFNVGIAESNLVGVAGGLASSGKTPVLASFAAFLLCNAYDQLRMSVAFPGLNVKFVGSHAGISIGADGPSQMGIEDVSLACSLPGVKVIVPCDAHSCAKATEAMLREQGPVYLRTGREKASVVHAENVEFTIGKAIQVRSGDDATIIANGLMVAAALDAATELAKDGVSCRVLDMHTAKPADEQAIQRAARETGAIVVAEEHLAHGGLGSVVAMIAARTNPVPIAFVNIGDCFAESGDPYGLLEKYGLTPGAIVKAVRSVVQR
jgi:transketolase